MAQREFLFHIPIEFVKSDDGKRIVRGFATTEHQDREGETVLQDGLDFTDLMKWGWFNDNHGKSASDKIGYPTRLEPKTYPDGRKGHYIEGELLRDYRPADRIWELGEALRKQAAPRQLGFSIEGTIDERRDNGKTIAKARVRNIAITADPINPYANVDMVVKALLAGGDVASPGAMQGSGFPLRPESLEGSQTNLAGPKKKKRKKRMTKGEAVDWFMSRGYTLDAAVMLTKLARRSQ